MEEIHTLTKSRHFLHELHALRAVDAPAAVLPGVMARIGLGDAFAHLDTPIGPFFVAYNSTGISMIRPADDAEVFARHVRAHFGRPAYQAPALPAGLAEAVREQLMAGHADGLSFDLRQQTAFEREVLLKALEIPRGEVRPYSWIAREIGRPKAVRAVGTALSHNPIPILIPCHRVIQSNGEIGRYIFGSAAKNTILAAEGAAPDRLEELAHRGVRYLGDSADGTFCLPSCGGLHRRDDPRLVPFRSDAEALGAGYRPCQTCRPVAIGADTS